MNLPNKWAVRITSLEDAEELQRIFPTILTLNELKELL